METQSEQDKFEKFLNCVGQGIDDIESNLARSRAIKILEGLDQEAKLNHGRLVALAQLQYRLAMMREAEERLQAVSSSSNGNDKHASKLRGLVDEAILEVEGEIQKTAADDSDIMASNNAIGGISSVTLKAINDVLGAEQTVFDLLDEGGYDQHKLQTRLQFMENVSLRFLRGYISEKLHNGQDTLDCYRDDLQTLNDALLEVEVLVGVPNVCYTDDVIANDAITMAIGIKSRDDWKILANVGYMKRGCIIDSAIKHLDEGIISLDLLMSKLHVFCSNPRPSDRAIFGVRSWKRDAKKLFLDVVEELGRCGNVKTRLNTLLGEFAPSAIGEQLTLARNVVKQCWLYLGHIKKIVEVVGKMVADERKPLHLIARNLRYEKAIEMIVAILKSDRSIGHSVRMPDPLGAEGQLRT